MEFEWDERKQVSNFEKHGVDLEVAARIFEGTILRRHDRRAEYGEDRWNALGRFDGTVYNVTYTMRDDVFRIIAAWKGGRKEHDEYHTYVSR